MDVLLLDRAMTQVQLTANTKDLPHSRYFILLSSHLYPAHDPASGNQ